MAQIFFKKAGRRPSAFATFGLIMMILAALCLLIAGPGLGYFQQSSESPNDIFDWRHRLISLAQIILAIGAGSTIIGILHGRYSKRVRMSARAFLAVLFGLCVAAPIGFLKFAASEHPLHDISTNTDDPPSFELLRERSYDTADELSMIGGRLDMAYDAKHRALYPALKPVLVDGTTDDILRRARTAALELGWQIPAGSISPNQLEATYMNRWSNLIHQVAIRVRSTDAAGRSKLDIRVQTRLGVSDYGVGARQIERFRAQFLELSPISDTQKQ